MKKIFLISFILFCLTSFTVKGQNSTCQCAVFEKKESKTPIMSRTPGFTVRCNKPEDRDSCKRLCVALAQAATEVAPKLLCEVVKVHLDGMMPSVFYKICDDVKWLDTGLTSSDHICCRDGLPTRCGQL